MSKGKKFLLFAFLIYALVLIYSCSLTGSGVKDIKCIFGDCRSFTIEKIEWCESLDKNARPGFFGRYDTCDVYPYSQGCPCYGIKEKLNE